ncbi:choice-of-anchor M domain-containing protein [Cerasicoccus frondis]|uniref:choice-of-anchor M domain-containing protein n=1 Tax=Cerasicoccus frondis TaxID=490090 RepID=UPI0028526875|nr:choice-of-anchor M domain-containing protein [Cerasicoccus frondis]
MPATASWTTEIIYGSDYNDPQSSAPFDGVVFPLRDAPSASGGARFTVPASGFEFLGVAAGASFWLAPEFDYGYAWPGFNTDQPTGSIASYTTSDPRKSSEGSQAWIKINLVEVVYFGEGANPQVSLWQTTGPGEAVVWAATSDGLDSSDAFYQLAQGHSHLNWGFTEKGVYRLGMQASAYTGEDMTDPTQSGVDGVFFAVGSYAIWKAEYFSGDDLVNEAVTGAAADPDADGVPLMLEYAFNLLPDAPDVSYVESETGVSGLPSMSLNNDNQLQIEYVRRKESTSPDISYEAQFGSGLDAEDWEAATEEVATSIDAEWERVVVTDSVTEASRRFGRVMVTLEP